MPLLVEGETQPPGSRSLRPRWRIAVLLACLGVVAAVPLSPFPVRLGEYWVTGPYLDRTRAIYGTEVVGQRSFLWLDAGPSGSRRRPEFWGQSVATLGPFVVWHMEFVGKYAKD